jgi:hypothetical protein
MGEGLTAQLQPQQRMERRGDERTNRRTRAESQWIVGQAHSHTYNTLSQLSRLQTICINNNSKLRFTGKSAPFTVTELNPHLMNLGQRPIVFHLLLIETLLSSMDSDLEAFSHNPTDGSFTALAFQLTVFTNYLNQLFLSY